MTAQLLERLAVAGHRVSVSVGDGNGRWVWHGLPVTGSALETPASADVVIVHGGRSWPGIEHRHRTGSKLVMVCHNTSEGVRDDLAGAHPDMVVTNSVTMAEDLGVDSLVVNPPAPKVEPLEPGDRIVILSLSELKGGVQFLRLAERMPHRRFLAVRGGYGKQLQTKLPNVEVIDHVPHDELRERVWARAGVFLQLSSSESWGMAAGEAMAHGVPVIAHPTPGLQENLGTAAAWVDRDDSAGLSAAVEQVLGDVRARSRGLARAREHAATSAAQLDEWVAAIERLAHGQGDQRDGAARGLHRVGV
jgi:glycosyltransferase involved in cell wall biosynthesis